MVVFWVGSSSGSDLPPTTHPTDFVSTLVPYAQQDEDSAISDTLAGLDSSYFTSLRLGPPQGDGVAQGLWLYATLRGDSAEAGSGVRFGWEADLAQGAIAERLAGDRPDLGEVITGSVETLVLPDGSQANLGGGAGNITAGQRFGAQESGATDEQITASVSNTLEEFGLTPQTVRVLRPLGPAVYAVATIDDVKSLAGKFETLRSAILGSPYQYEGLYLEIDQVDGTPLVRAGTAYRSGAGTLWFAPGIDEVLGLAHGGTPTHTAGSATRGR